MSSWDEREHELAGRGVELRSAGEDDHDLIERIVGLAGHWRSIDPPRMLDAELDKYHVGWGRTGDLGVLVFSGIEFVGGAFVRSFAESDGAYGFVEARYPELCMGVEPAHRRRGLGVIMLAALKAKVIDDGGAGISLSVEPDNGARQLYRRMGFDLVEDRGNDLLMLWRP